jgi:hypothetical protein
VFGGIAALDGGCVEVAYGGDLAKLTAGGAGARVGAGLCAGTGVVLRLLVGDAVDHAEHQLARAVVGQVFHHATGRCFGIGDF